MRELVVTEPGYAYIFFSNENQKQVDIHFDDATVTLTHSPIVAGGDYYPFGLVMEDREVTDENYRYGFQGQFSEKDLTYGMQEFELRMYDARIGRWMSPDPYGQYPSSYLAMGNIPHMKIDPNGGIDIPAVTVYGSSFVTMAVSAAFSSIGSGIFSAMCCPDPPGYVDRRGMNHNISQSREQLQYERGLTTYEVSGMGDPSSQLFPPIQNNHTISALKPTFWSSVAQSSNFLVSTGYSIINGANLASYFFTPWRRTPINLDGQLRRVERG